MDVTPESRYGDLVRQLNEYGNPAGTRVLFRSMDPEVATRTVVDGVLAFLATGSSDDAAERVLRHSVHVGVNAAELIRYAFEAGIAEGRRSQRPKAKAKKASS